MTDKKEVVLADAGQLVSPIGELNEQKFPLQNELSKAESDFGPIKYVAELIYGTGGQDIIDKAVRLVIMLIMVVFDPLAVLLLIAANSSLEQKTKTPEDFFERVKESAKKLDEEYTPDPYVPDVGEKPTQEELQEIDETVINIEKDNLANIVIDDATGETIPPISHEKVEVHLVPGVYHEHHAPAKKLEPKYNYDDPYAFREKEK